MSAINKVIDHLLEKYQSAIYARDAVALMKLYDAKVRVFDTWGIWSYENAASRQLAVEAWFTSLGVERVKVGFEDVQFTGTPELGIVSAVATYTAISAQGESLRSMQNRLTWGLRTSGHVLRIMHEHTSVPISFEGATGIFQRHSSP